MSTCELTGSRCEQVLGHDVSTCVDAVLNTRVEATERDEDVPVFKPRSDISLQVPRELLVTLGNRSLARSNRQVRMVSLLFSNGKELFPNVTLHGIK